MLKKVEGIVLKKEFEVVWKIFKLESEVMLWGSVFVKWLEVSDKDDNFVRLNSVVGILLVRLL